MDWVHVSITHFFCSQNMVVLTEHLLYMDLALEKIIIPNAEVEQGYSLMTPLKYFLKGISTFCTKRVLVIHIQWPQ